MSTFKMIISCAALITALAGFAGAADNSGRIYGVLTTVDGDVFEGLIRWDKNEASWVDVLNGNKELPDDESSVKTRRKYRESRSSVKILGITIGDDNGNWDFSGIAQSGIRFGHIKSLEVIDDERARLVLKSGEQVELEGGSTDLGGDVREIIIEDKNEGEVELVWDDVEKIEFMPARSDLQSGFGERLYGTLTTRRGDEFTGFICWDVDELFSGDILDGSEDGRKRKVPFGKIASIERYSSSGATLSMKSGDPMLLKESNDIDDGNRGIIISDPAFGQVTVEWDEFDKLVFKEAPRAVGYDNFDGGRRLYGTVFTDAGDQYVGKIRWDNDEEYSWEILDGEYHDLEFDIEFGLVKSIAKKSYRSAQIVVSDGREFRLRGSNDIDEDNRGLVITQDNGTVVEVDWEDFDRVEFKQK